jgi:hypothetical protein
LNYSLRENLEVCADDTGYSIRCTRCSYVLSSTLEGWRKGCKVQLLSPMEAGPLMEIATSQFLLEQLLCPSCGVLINTRLVEKEEYKDE